jgi:hypothetical protein
VTASLTTDESVAFIKLTVALPRAVPFSSFADPLICCACAKTVVADRRSSIRIRMIFGFKFRAQTYNPD